MISFKVIKAVFYVIASLLWLAAVLGSIRESKDSGMRNLLLIGLYLMFPPIGVFMGIVSIVDFIRSRNHTAKQRDYTPVFGQEEKQGAGERKAGGASSPDGPVTTIGVSSDVGVQGGYVVRMADADDTGRTEKKPEAKPDRNNGNTAGAKPGRNSGTTAAPESSASSGERVPAAVLVGLVKGGVLSAEDHPAGMEYADALLHIMPELAPLRDADPLQLKDRPLRDARGVFLMREILFSRERSILCHVVLHGGAFYLVTYLSCDYVDPETGCRTRTRIDHFPLDAGKVRALALLNGCGDPDRVLHPRAAETREDACAEACFDEEVAQEA